MPVRRGNKSFIAAAAAVPLQWVSHSRIRLGDMKEFLGMASRLVSLMLLRPGRRPVVIRSARRR
jgi:hypothetical protein